jgi:hypothetical protein
LFLTFIFIFFIIRFCLNESRPKTGYLNLILITYSAGILIIVFTIVTEATNEIALPFNTVS